MRTVLTNRDEMLAGGWQWEESVTRREETVCTLVFCAFISIGSCGVGQTRFWVIQALYVKEK
jgi:hypothetical protein